MLSGKAIDENLANLNTRDENEVRREVLDEPHSFDVTLDFSLQMMAGADVVEIACRGKKPRPDGLCIKSPPLCYAFTNGNDMLRNFTIGNIMA
jgi:hypothetical protein